MERSRLTFIWFVVQLPSLVQWLMSSEQLKAIQCKKMILKTQSGNMSINRKIEKHLLVSSQYGMALRV